MIFLVSEVLVKEDFKANRTRFVSEIILVSIYPSKQTKIAKISSVDSCTSQFSLHDSGFCHEVDENCSVLGYYTVSSDNSLLMFRDNLLFSLTLEEGTNRLSQNVGKELSLLAA